MSSPYPTFTFVCKADSTCDHLQLCLQVDILGMDVGSAARPAAPAAPQMATADDLGDFFGAPAQPPPPAAATVAAEPDLDIFAARPLAPARANGHATAPPRQQQQQQQRAPPRPAASDRAPTKGPVLDDQVQKLVCSGVKSCVDEHMVFINLQQVLQSLRAQRVARRKIASRLTSWAQLLSVSASLHAAAMESGRLSTPR